MRYSLKLFLLLIPTLSFAVIFDTVPSALAKSFGKDIKIKRSTYFLKKKQQKQLAEIIGETPSRLVVYYEGQNNGNLKGTVFIDTHRVRTMKQTVLFLVSVEGKIKRVQPLQFLEPQEYMAPENWIKQLLNRELNDSLSLKGDIAGISGATLTARAYTQAARRVLALHQTIYAKSSQLQSAAH